MRVADCFLAILLLARPVMFAQDRPTLHKEPSQDNPPTLGKDEGPSLSGPRTSTTTDARRLLSFKAIFVDHIDNALSEKLADGLSKMGRFRIVTDRKDADTVVYGTCFDSRRLKTLHSEIFLHDRASGASIWQDVVRRHYNPPPLPKVVDDTATMILAHLGERIQEAQRK